MAEQHQDEAEPRLLSYFPSPPPFYRHFSADNVARLAKFKEDRAIDHLTASHVLELPPELRYMVPPKPPAEDAEYLVFNQPTQLRTANESLQSWGIEQLYPSPPSPAAGEDSTSRADWTYDRATYLKRLLRSLLLNYVELVGIMAQDPKSERKEEKLKDMHTIATNMHSIINEYRPHQTRETIINMMEEQLDRKRAEIDAIRKLKDKFDTTMAHFARNAPDRHVEANEEGQRSTMDDEKRKESQRDMWLAMDELLGH
ncbi:hypothetical protein EJ04DRAFT_562983 [Polyplosphaeria fusca]|uniref:Mediator of RNA polymerase II transcription subunit 7 n=1 Tax=Polyplosphaeria fusca TaxID=682080 RepID=A0A9P4R2J1_9PLEO|nr:hypothetical protein EJ04DRAFT_562983 [Polyplosphaeria fusca]